MISKVKINTIFDENEEIEDCKEFKPQGYEIVFKDVEFSYSDGEPVLRGVNAVIPENSLTAIVGESGACKSTVFNLLAKYYSPDKGTITIGGQDIVNSDVENVMSDISMVDQDVFLFDDTIQNNILYAREDASDDEIRKACMQANCDDFINELEDKYNTVVGENGNKFSGGERQRLSVARAILRDSKIILLDEATSSLDIENELLVKRAIENLMKKNKTVLMIAHNLSVVKDADNILVMDDGRIIESGTHEELLKLRI